MPTNIFFLGATGYIGGSFLARLIERPDFATLNITLLVRSTEKAAKFATFGLTPVVGSHTDSELVEKLSSEADVVVSAADSDYLPAIQAILRGLKTRYKNTGNGPSLIHLSGTGVLADNALGQYSSDTIYDDANPEQIKTLPITQIHRWVDVELDAADAEGYVKTYIVLPSTVYGIASNPFVDAGIQNPRSIQVPRLLNAALARGQGGLVGAGKNLWNDVSIDDIADLLLVLYDSIRTNPSGTGHGHEGYYFGENGTHSLHEVGKLISEGLVAHGKGKSPEPTSFTDKEIDKYLGRDFAVACLGSNSRAIANRSRSIGWKPKHTTRDFLASIKTEVELSLKN